MAPTWLPAVLLTALIGGTFGANTVNQTEGSVVISQGDPLRLNCTYEFSAPPDYLFWYVQYPGQAPRMFLRDLGRQDSDEGIRKGFNATHEKQKKSFHLRKPAGQMSDSATYYCAGRDTVIRAGSGAAQKLRSGRPKSAQVLCRVGKGDTPPHIPPTPYNSGESWLQLCSRRKAPAGRSVSAKYKHKPYQEGGGKYPLGY